MLVGQGGHYAVAVSPNGMLLAGSAYDKTIGIWDLATIKALLASPASGHKADVMTVTFSPDNQT
ncbi:hypothetical protein, partial [Salmonella sp. SAL4437]|uniref:hypothetical protein n=1 Tax=Salmonella sp. SAL4437 TaxID=3159892 RepID=UPI00397A0141